MMLVASLFISGSYDRIAGYAPGSQVTDHNAVDLDQKVMEDHLKAGDFAKALNVYDNGGNSKSYAELTIPATTKNIMKGAYMEATRRVADNELGEPTKAIGKAYADYPAGSTVIRFQYKTSDTQWKADGTTPGYNQDCRVGGMEPGDAYYSADGCVDGSKTVMVTFEDGSTENIAPQFVAHKNGRTIKGFSTGAQMKMYDGCPGCPYEDYEKFYEYYGSHTYADDWVRAALTGGNAGFTKGNIDFTKAIKSYDGTAETAGAVGDAQAIAMRVQAAKKGAAYMNTWMYVLREFEDAIDDCKSNCIACNDDPVHAWDEGVAFWTGSLEKEDGFSSGKQIYALAEKRCKDFKTCGKDSGMNSLKTEGATVDQDVTAKVNYDLFYHFANGEFLLAYGRCDEVRPVLRKVVALMTVPLIQGTLKYVYKKFAPPMPTGAEDFADIQSEGATFAAAVLPMVAACNEDDAATIEKHASLHSETWSATNRPDYASWNEVKTAFENNYACLGITCADIGGLYGDLNEGQPGADGRRLAEMGYFEGAEPCSDSVTLSAGEYDQIAGYEPGSQVTDHAAIDQDQNAMESYLKLPNFPAAKNIYKLGGFSKSYAELTVPATPRAISKGAPMYATSLTGGAVAGKAYDNYGAGSTKIRFQYKTGDSQDTYSNCKAGGLIGALMEPAATYTYSGADTSGCLDVSKAVLVTFDSAGGRTVLKDVGATAIKHKNGRTLAGFSTGAGKKMLKDCGTGCGNGKRDYDDFMKFKTYYGVNDYADHWVTKALDGAKTEFTGPASNTDFSVADDAMRVQVIKKGTAYMNVWMYVIREFEDAIDDCTSCTSNCNEHSTNSDSVHAWDEGVAFYTGSLEGTAYGGNSDGKLLYRLAEKRCANFGTCLESGTGATGTSQVNSELFQLFDRGRDWLQQGRCSSVRPLVNQIVSLMTVPLVQGALRYAYKNIQAGTDMASPKNAAEGATFSAAVLPLVHHCNTASAAVVSDNLKFGLFPTGGDADPARYSDFAAVKAAFEDVYACLGITCAQVGGLPGVAAAAACTHQSAVIAGYVPGSDVTQHNQIDLDQKDIETALAAADFGLAKTRYTVGGNSKTAAPFRTLQGFSTGAQAKMYDGCPGCPYKHYKMFYDYYGSYTYADDWVSAALAGRLMTFSSGKHGPNNFHKLGDAARIEAVKKGTAYMNVWMYVIREFEDAIDDCDNSCIACNDDPVHAWDEGVAFYAGSLAADTPNAAGGSLIWALAEKRCKGRRAAARPCTSTRARWRRRTARATGGDPAPSPTASSPTRGPRSSPPPACPRS